MENLLGNINGFNFKVYLSKSPNISKVKNFMY